MLDAFKAASDDLIAAGVDGIMTTCGFLALYQKDLAAYCAVPVAISPLQQVPMVARILLGGERPAILTFAAEKFLTLRHLEAVGVDSATRIQGIPPGSESQRAIREGDNSVPFATLQREVLEAADRMVRGHQYRCVSARMHEPRALLARYRSSDEPARLRHRWCTGSIAA
jgi:hypothetical protein